MKMSFREGYFREKNYKNFLGKPLADLHNFIHFLLMKIAFRTSQIVGTLNTRWTITKLSFHRADMDCEFISLLGIIN